MKVCFETFGCRLNRAEALQQEAEYLDKGWTTTTKHSEADLFVVRACSVTSRAQRDCERLIAHLKKRYPLTPLIVAGCLPKESKRALHVSDHQQNVPHNPTAIPTSTARAYLKVQDGCNCGCTFCIVPQFRGKSTSVPFDEVLAKASRFIDAGYHEIVVTGCNLTLYSSDGRSFADLIDALANLSPDCRIRIGSIEPGTSAIETVDVMAKYQNICKFLHLPIQSGSNAILKSMRRPYLVADIDRLIKKAQSTIQLIGLGCDIMSGYPGETEIDHLATVGMLKRYGFSNIHAFPFSERPNTIAAGLPSIVPREIRHARAREINSIGRELKSVAARKFLGKDI